MNLKDHIKNYKFNSLVKVSIDKTNLTGLIIQKEYMGPVYFFNYINQSFFSKFRLLENSSGFEIVPLVNIRPDDEDNHHYRWLYSNYIELFNIKPIMIGV